MVVLCLHSWQPLNQPFKHHPFSRAFSSFSFSTMNPSDDWPWRPPQTPPSHRPFPSEYPRHRPYHPHMQSFVSCRWIRLSNQRRRPVPLSLIWWRQLHPPAIHPRSISPPTSFSSTTTFYRPFYCRSRCHRYGRCSTNFHFGSRSADSHRWNTSKRNSNHQTSHFRFLQHWRAAGLSNTSHPLPRLPRESFFGSVTSYNRRQVFCPAYYLNTSMLDAASL